MKTPYILLLALLFCAFPVSAQNNDLNTPSAWSAEHQGLSQLGDGFLVWESNRSGNFRIWRMELDGTGLRKISPDEQGRDHYCPHLSPDGRCLVYTSMPVGQNTYSEYKTSDKCPLHIMKTDGTGDRVLVDDVRAYGEDRAVVWLSAHELEYIDGQGYTCRLDTSTGESRKLPGDPHKTFGYLISPNRKVATDGWATKFPDYDQATGNTTNPKGYEGCQPYFTSDGKWGFWMGGAGGPINRVNLSSWEVSPIILKDDPRMPQSRAYLYFPMFSYNRRLFAFGASPNQHDHFTADYDIFVAQTAPDTLEIIGKPVRYTFDPGCDRFPDVYIANLALGSKSGEAPFTVDYGKVPGEHTWSYGDGTPETTLAKHTYTKPGRYKVKANQSDISLAGMVRVLPPAPPRVISVVRRGENKVVVTFDEPIQRRGLKASLSSGTKVTSTALENGNRALVLNTDQPLLAEEKVSLDGIYDTAQQPNKLPIAPLTIKDTSWPGTTDRLVFMWQSSNKGAAVRDKSGKPIAPNAVSRMGMARYDHDYSMQTAGGCFQAEESAQTLLSACKTSGEFTIEAVVETDSLEQSGPARIVSFSNSPSSRNFTIGQEKNKIILRLRTTETNVNGTAPEMELCSIEVGKPYHILVTYKPGTLDFYRNGRKELSTNTIRGSFANWEEQHLLFGDEWGGQRNWRGRVSHVAIYNRYMDEAAARTEWDAGSAQLAGRSPVAKVKVEARLLQTSQVPTLKQILPYKDALVVNEYQLERVLKGSMKAGKVRVVQWAIANGTDSTVGGLKIGEVYTLLLEPMEANPELESIYCSDTLKQDFDIPMLYNTD